MLGCSHEKTGDAARMINSYVDALKKTQYTMSEIINEVVAMYPSHVKRAEQYLSRSDAAARESRLLQKSRKRAQEVCSSSDVDADSESQSQSILATKRPIYAKKSKPPTQVGRTPPALEKKRQPRLQAHYDPTMDETPAAANKEEAFTVS